MAWRVACFVVLVAWVATMVFSLTMSMLGFSIPETLTSPEFTAAGCGFSFLYTSLMHGQRGKGEKSEFILPVFGLIIGVSILSLGVFVILFRATNFFTYTCLIIGTALALLSAKQIQARIVTHGSS